MRFEYLHIEKFKSIENVTIPLDAGLTVLMGRNGTGKTNILEAASMFSPQAESFIRGAGRSTPKHSVWLQIGLDALAEDTWLGNELAEYREKADAGIDNQDDLDAFDRIAHLLLNQPVILLRSLRPGRATMFLGWRAGDSPADREIRQLTNEVWQRHLAKPPLPRISTDGPEPLRLRDRHRKKAIVEWLKSKGLEHVYRAHPCVLVEDLKNIIVDHESRSWPLAQPIAAVASAMDLDMTDMFESSLNGSIKGGQRFRQVSIHSAESLVLAGTTRVTVLEMQGALEDLDDLVAWTHDRLNHDDHPDGCWECISDDHGGFMHPEYSAWGDDTPGNFVVPPSR